MALSNAVATKTVRGRVGEEEWQARVELAAAYRLIAQHGHQEVVRQVRVAAAVASALQEAQVRRVVDRAGELAD